MNFGIVSTFSKDLGCAFSEGLVLGLDPLYKVYQKLELQKDIDKVTLLMILRMDPGKKIKISSKTDMIFKLI